ncbi:MAG: hypothetical protein COA78_25430 [Blastopirellula sp.]|nr:MAG: hypothetical protein COA78_25430 [Blastopirellula sp.]
MLFGLNTLITVWQQAIDLVGSAIADPTRSTTVVCYEQNLKKKFSTLLDSFLAFLRDSFATVEVIESLLKDAPEVPGTGYLMQILGLGERITRIIVKIAKETWKFCRNCDC